MFKKSKKEEFVAESQPEKVIVYIPPEALTMIEVMTEQEFERFQTSDEFVEGGRLYQVAKQYGYQLRQVADLVEEPISLPEADSTRPSLQGTRKPRKRTPVNEAPQELYMNDLQMNEVA